jgi:hypothetical protein
MEDELVDKKGNQCRKMMVMMIIINTSIKEGRKNETDEKQTNRKR